MTRVLFCSSEVQPLSKTGGLGDLAAALPRALHGLDCDVRIVTPAYRGALEQCGDARVVAGFALPQGGPVSVLEARLPDSGVPVYLIAAGGAFDRAGGPYLGPDGRDWPDNHLRFAAFSRAIVEMAMDRAGLDWRPQVVHCNDWQTGPVPALLAMEDGRPATVFTINNLAYQGLFTYEQFVELELPESLWSFDAMEFNGYFSFVKGGLAYSDWLVAVSPSYAEEIRTPAFGCGLDGLLRHRTDRLVGILNGIDEKAWDPAHDPALHSTYDRSSIERKLDNKLALQIRLKLRHSAEAVMLSNIGRLAGQKGAELIAGALPRLMSDPDVQFVVLGEGDPALAARFDKLARRWPDRMSFVAEFDEALAHQIEAAADIFLMPSLYEPCGLNQMYSMRYGTLPVVRRTGGLKDTVVCEGEAATGFCFDDASPEALVRTVRHAIALFREAPDAWRGMMIRGMAADFSWQRSAASYLSLYHRR